MRPRRPVPARRIPSRRVRSPGQATEGERKPFAGDDVARLVELLQAGGIAPVIDRRYSLAEVPEALRYLREGRARGKIIITV
jgi:NADPH:quinone reductase-like Zn-dependent oxidoreductase